jgi:hypothetical protein
MTRVAVECGACGFSADLEVVRAGNRQVRLKVASGCEAVNRWGAAVARIRWPAVLGRAPEIQEFWGSALDMLTHRTCPVPLAVLKAIEAEIGAARPADVTIRFLPSPEGDAVRGKGG